MNTIFLKGKHTLDNSKLFTLLTEKNVKPKSVEINEVFEKKISEPYIGHTLKINPSKRLTTPEDLSKVITMLGLSEHTWMTGNTIRIDGGEDIAG